MKTTTKFGICITLFVAIFIAMAAGLLYKTPLTGPALFIEFFVLIPLMFLWGADVTSEPYQFDDTKFDKFLKFIAKGWSLIFALLGLSISGGILIFLLYKLIVDQDVMVAIKAVMSFNLVLLHIAIVLFSLGLLANVFGKGAKESRPYYYKFKREKVTLKEIDDILNQELRLFNSLLTQKGFKFELDDDDVIWLLESNANYGKIELITQILLQGNEDEVIEYEGDNGIIYSQDIMLLSGVRYSWRLFRKKGTKKLLHDKAKIVEQEFQKYIHSSSVFKKEHLD